METNNILTHKHFKTLLRILKDNNLYGIQEKFSLKYYLRNNFHSFDLFNESSNVVNLMHMAMERSTNKKLLDLLWLTTYIIPYKVYNYYPIKDILNYIKDDCNQINNALLRKHPLTNTDVKHLTTYLNFDNIMKNDIIKDKVFIIKLVNYLKDE